MVAELPKEVEILKGIIQSFGLYLFCLEVKKLMLIEELIINNDFFHHYQPVYDIQDWRLIGHESLFRTENNTPPENVFNNAKIEKKLYELDSRSIHKACYTYAKAGYFSRCENLFLNVFPSTLTNPLFPTLVNKIINENGISSQQIILEINEEETYDFETTKKIILELKKLGIGIAIDDCGKGYSSLRSIIELYPDFVKLDKYFLKDINQQKIDVIKFLLQFCNKYDSQLIIEGIEDATILALLKSLGVQYAQGYLLGRPSSLSK